MATAATLLCGGALLALLGVVRGEIGAFDPSAVSAKSVIATVYLFIFGSIVGLHRVPLAAARDDRLARVDLRVRQSDRRRVPGLGAGGRAAEPPRVPRRRR